MQVTMVTVRKPDGRERRLSILDPQSAMRYRRAVMTVAPAVEARTSPVSFADRVGRSASSAKAALTSHLHALAPSDGVAVATDVRRFFGSVRPEILDAMLRRIGAWTADIHRVRHILDQCEDAGVIGLPIGPPSSGILAQALLGDLDRRLGDAAMGYARWVDDVIVITKDERQACETVVRAEEMLSDVGLQLNHAKTRYLDPAGITSGWITSVS